MTSNDPSSDTLRDPTRRTLLALAAATLASAGAARAQIIPPIRLGQINLSFYGVVGGVVRTFLAERGHEIVTSEGTHPEMYRRLGAGELDLLVAAWLPHAHGQLHAQMTGRVIEFSTLYDDALLYWAVPSYIPAEAVRSVADLAKPEVARRMDREIVGVGPGSGSIVGSERIMREYGLDRAGYALRVGSPAEWAGRLDAAVKEGRWTAIPLWRPHWLNRAYDLRILEEPRRIFAPDRCVLLAGRNATDQWPAKTVALVQAIKLDVEAVTDMDFRANVGGLKPLDAARAWIGDHAVRVQRWRVAAR